MTDGRGEETGFRAGVAREDVSPEAGTPLAGYATLTVRRSKGVRDPLSATALVVQDAEGRRAAVVAIDQLAVSEGFVRKVREGAAAEAGVPPEALLVAASHSHSAPLASIVAGRTDPKQERYVEALVAKVVRAVSRAAKGLRPAEAAAATGETKIAINRRERGVGGKVKMGVQPGGPVDRTVGVVQVWDAGGGGPIATLVNLACHPTFLAPKHRLASAEWPGVMRRVVEEATGAPVVFLQGGTGDLNPDHEWGKDELGQMERRGLEVAADVLRALEKATPIAAGPVGGAVEEVWFDLVGERRRFGTGTMDHRQALSRLAKHLVPTALVDRVLDAQYPYRTGLVVDGAGARVPMEVQALRLGDLALVAHAAESFHGIGLAVKDASPATRTLYAGYSNGMIGYLPTREEQPLGGYEVEVVPYLYRLPGLLAHDSGERAVATSLALLRRLYDAGAVGPPA